MMIGDIKHLKQFKIKKFKTFTCEKYFTTVHSCITINIIFISIIGDVKYLANGIRKIGVASVSEDATENLKEQLMKQMPSQLQMAHSVEITMSVNKVVNNFSSNYDAHVYPLHF